MVLGDRSLLARLGRLGEGSAVGWHVDAGPVPASGLGPPRPRVPIRRPKHRGRRRSHPLARRKQNIAGVKRPNAWGGHQSGLCVARRTPNPQCRIHESVLASSPGKPAMRRRLLASKNSGRTSARGLFKWSSSPGRPLGRSSTITGRPTSGSVSDIRRSSGANRPRCSASHHPALWRYAISAEKSGAPVRLLQPGSGRSQLTQPSPEISVGIAEVSRFA